MSSHGNHPPSTGFVKCLTRLQANETARSGHDSHFLENSTLQATTLFSAQLPSVYPEQRVSTWYAKDTQERSEAQIETQYRPFNKRELRGFECAKTAYLEARTLFRSSLNDEEYNLIFPPKTMTIHDVEEAVIAAREKYQNRSGQSKARKWLANCSKRVIYYGVIMDTLSQHHPEYVSLAWGALKFLFIVSQSLRLILS
jgi:hypothetical protein